MRISGRGAKVFFFGLSAIFIVFLFFGYVFLFFGYCQGQIGDVTSTVDIFIKARVGLPPEVPPPFYPPLPAEVTFQGRAYPNAFLTILKDGEVAATFLAQPSGFFEKTLTGIRAGGYTFGIWAEDTEGRQSITLSFTVNIPPGALVTISRIFIPPTISLFPTKVASGEIINISGQAFPRSRIYLFISPLEIVKKTVADSLGKWNFKLDTSLLREGEYGVRAKAIFEDGQQTEFSQTFYFSVLVPVCMGADLNFDGRVDLVDFSILLYFWRQTKPANICADINGDGIVDIVDFSIMMYFWTG